MRRIYSAISCSEDEERFREILVSTKFDDLSRFDSALRDFLQNRTIL